MSGIARAYIRVSSERQTLGVSLETQRAAIRAYAETHNLVIAHEYTDVLSGTRDDRPRYRQMLADLQSGETCLVWRIDRIGRRKSELFRFFEWCKQHRVALISVTQPEMSSELARDIMSVIAAYESQQIAERSMPAKLARAEDGRWMSRPPVYYVIGEDGHLTPTENADEAQRLFDTLLTTGNIQTTAAVFGYYPRTLARIVTNRAYLGEMRWHGVVIPDAHPALVRRETWDAVQALIRQRGVEHRRERRDTALLTGYLYLADTDTRLYHDVHYHQTVSGERAIRYYRSDRLGARLAASVRAEYVEGIVIDRLAALEMTKAEITHAERELRAHLRVDPYRTDRARITRRLAALERELMETNRMEAQRRITAHEADRMRAAQRAEIAAQDASRAALPAVPDAARVRAALHLRLNLAALVRRAYTEGQITHLRILMEAFIARVEVWGGEAERTVRRRQLPREIRIILRD